MTDKVLHDEFDFLVLHNGGKWIPCIVKFNEQKQKYSKIRAKWLTDGHDDGNYGKCEHIMLETGEETGQFVIDIDRLNPNREDHKGKIDGLKFFEDWCGPVLNPDTLTIKTISGGYHKVFKSSEGISLNLKSGYLDPAALVEILWNKKTYTYGKGYETIYKIPPQVPSDKIQIFLTINQHITINNYSNTYSENNTLCTPHGVSASTVPDTISNKVNKLLETDCKWKVIKHDEDYKLTPVTNICCVEDGYVHTEAEHSCIHVRKKSVFITCFRHGTIMLKGNKSRLLRQIFFNLEETAGVMTNIVERILLDAESKGFVRDNGSVFKLERSHNKYKYELVSSYEDFLKVVLKDDSALIERPRRFNELMIYMEKVDSSRFPFVKRNKRYIGFSNGLLDIVDGILVDYDTLGADSMPRHYINQPFDVSDEFLQTPLFDTIVRYQLDDDDVYTCMLALIGRLFYEVGEFDKFDVMPFIIGDTKTGKSSLTDIICAMFSPDSVGVIDSTHENIFGLQSKYDKELLIATEISDKIAHQLSSDTFKRMVCGEIVNVAVKHAKSHSVQWKVPMFMCGNQHLNYQDDRGSISRRLAIFRFEKYVEKADTSLKAAIIDKELSKITVKCLYAYRRLLEYTGTDEFWNKCPQYFKDNIDDMSHETDYIHMFLSLGPNDNVWGSKHMYFVKQQGSIMFMEDFKKKFFNWLRFRHQNAKYKWTSDHSAFRRRGFEVVRTKICKICEQEAHRNCCSHYDKDNRSTRTVIKNIACIEEER